MNSKKLTSLIGFLSLILLQYALFAQPRNQPQRSVIQKVTLYYNGAAQLTLPEKATFKRVADLNISAMVFDGVYQDFDLNDKLIAEGYFHQGHKRSLLNEYFPDRSLKSSIDFSENDFVIWQLKSVDKVETVTNGSGKFTIPFYYGMGTTLQPRWRQGMMEGEFQFGKRVGLWTYFDLNKSKLDEEVYDKGKLVNRIHFEANGSSVELDYKKEIVLSLSTLLEEIMVFDETSFVNLNDAFAKSVTYSTTFNRPPTFAGGLKRLLLLIANHIGIPETTSLLIVVSINEQGVVTGSSIQQGISRTIDASALDYLRSLDKKLFPAIRKGKPYSSQLYLPIYGGAEGTKRILELPFDFVQEEN